MTAGDRDAVGRSVVSQAPVQSAALVVGGVFLLIGVLGFVPGVTTGYDSLTFAGHYPGATLLGLFTVSVLHNVVHLVFGVAGVVLAGTFVGARTYLMGSGLVYLMLFIGGVVVDQDGAANIVPINDNDHRLHLGLAVGMLLLGAVLGGPAPRRSPLPRSTAAPISQVSGR